MNEIFLPISSIVLIHLDITKGISVFSRLIVSLRSSPKTICGSASALFLIYIYFY